MKRMRILTASVCVALLGGFAFAAKPKGPVKEEPNYYYGYGKGSTPEEAELLGKKNLVENALAMTLKNSNAKSTRVSVSNESAMERLSKVKVWQKNDKAGADVVYRIKIEDWDKEEKAFSEKLRGDLGSKVSSLAGKKNLADKINESVEILNVLASNGETELLTEAEGSTELISRKVESICKDAVGELQFTLAAKDGFVDSNTKFSVSVVDSTGKAVAGLKVKTVWSLSTTLPASSDEELPEVTAVSLSDKSGKLTVSYPEAAEFHNKAVVLTVSTAFAESKEATSAMKKLDVASSVDGNYVHFDDVKAALTAKSANIEAGEFAAGAVSQDTIGSKNAREASRKVTTKAYSIALTPVTNAEYAAYIHATRSESVPEYFDNASYNQPEQPVIGVSISDAEAYAAWLSEQTGATYRLPTEEEWEKAARAGKNSIYPWGDDDPKKAKAANFKGNGKFKTTSPVGAFEAGKNELGIVDMSGNVWEWTSSTRDTNSDTTKRTVKGGSYLDGPKELRISNYKDLDGQNGYVDVGFRLVKEISE